MSEKDLIERAHNDERTRRLLNQIVKRALFSRLQPTGVELHIRPHLRPHTWVFLYQRDNHKEPIIRLGIVFHTWDRARYNMLRFTAHTKAGGEVTTSGRLTVLDNGDTGIIIDVRWPWVTLLKKFKGLSAGDL